MLERRMFRAAVLGASFCSAMLTLRATAGQVSTPQEYEHPSFGSFRGAFVEKNFRVAGCNLFKRD